MRRRDFLKSWTAAPLLPAVQSEPGRSQAKAAYDFSHPYVPATDWPKLPSRPRSRLWRGARARKPFLCCTGATLPSSVLIRKATWSDLGEMARSAWDTTFGTIRGMSGSRTSNVTSCSNSLLPAALSWPSVRRTSRGKALDQFNMPTDVAFLLSGDFYVADGYGNSRIMRFTAAAMLVHLWGTQGRCTWRVRLTPHDMVVDTRGRVYVSDRANSRIQFVDFNKKYGFTACEIQGRRPRWEQEVEAHRMMRKACPALNLRIDPNAPGV